MCTLTRTHTLYYEEASRLFGVHMYVIYEFICNSNRYQKCRTLEVLAADQTCVHIDIAH